MELKQSIILTSEERQTCALRVANPYYSNNVVAVLRIPLLNLFLPEQQPFCSSAVTAAILFICCNSSHFVHNR
jgi:hypothetical protein